MERKNSGSCAAPVRFETARLVIREFAEGDFAPFHGFASDMEVMRYMQDRPCTEEQSAKFLAMAGREREKEPRANWYLAAALREDGALVGTCNFNLSSEFPDAFLGVILARRAQSRGLGTEAARALLGFGFDALGLGKVWGFCNVANTASARMLEKAGMTLERIDEGPHFGIMRWSVVRAEGAA